MNEEMNEKLNEIEQQRHELHQCIKCGGEDNYTQHGRRLCKDCSPARQPESLCCKCNNIVPIKRDKKYITGCEWSLQDKPVPGWKAIKSNIQGNESGFCILECPKYTPYVRACEMHKRLGDYE